MVSMGNPQVIEIDDESSASEKGGAPKKRKTAKQEAHISEKVLWTDESDSVPSRPKRRTKRKSLKKEKSKDGGKQGKAEPLDEEDLDLTAVPEYLQQRRKEFDSRKKRFHDAALMLPPDYTDINVDDDARPESTLEKRPQFSESSGVKPSRSYQDIELPKSAGIIPASIAQYLRDYQVEGVAFLHRKFVFQEGGILGDDMGLGKTVQVAAFLTVAFGKTGDERDSKRLREIRFHSDRWYPRILIICPGSLIANWKNELNRWGWWHIDIFHGHNKDDVLGTARSGLLEIMITTYETYKNSRGSVNMVQWDAVIADECHRLKDRYSETTKALNEINALCRIGLTGTAIQNKYEELWTLLDWTNPGHFGTSREWTQTISRPLTVGQSHEATVAQLSLARQTAKKLVENLLPRYFLRRMKSLIANQLPKKTDRVVFCPLTDLQKEAYDNFLSSPEIELLRSISDTCEHGKKQGWCCGTVLSNGQRWQSIVFPSMMVLQKLANHLSLLTPSTTDLESKHESELNVLRACLPDMWETLYNQRDQIRTLVNPEFCGKWKVLRRLLKFWHSNGDKVLVFSHSVRLLRILQHLFTNTSYTVSYLDGSLTYEQRQEVVDSFNSDPTRFVFLISTKAGGVGLNITSANKVVIVDPHWNPAYDLQAQDRAYRIGQTRDVEVFRLISLGTVEEIVYARQIYKQQQANIGYTASSERRYFRGVQQDTERQGEIFGLINIFTFHSESSLLRNIVNKTNIAEAKAGVSLVDVDIDQVIKDEQNIGLVKTEQADSEDGGVGQLARLLTAENQQKLLKDRKEATPKSDVVQAILSAAGVEYTHENSEVIGSSKIEEQLSRRATMSAFSEGDIQGQSTLFSTFNPTSGLHYIYNPPEDVQTRQFCEMAREFGFSDPTKFALIVEGWSQEARRNCLDMFYKRRQAKLERAGDMAKQDDKEECTRQSIAGPGSKTKKEEYVGKDTKMEEVEDKKVYVETGNDFDRVAKYETKGEDKITVKDETDGTTLTILKSEHNRHGEIGTKDEINSDFNNESKAGIKDIDSIKTENKRTSIFLSDDDDDEL